MPDGAPTAVPEASVAAVAAAAPKRIAALARLLSIVGHPFVVPSVTALATAARRGAGAGEIGLLCALLAATAATMTAYSLRRVRAGRWQHMDASAPAERRDLNRFSFAIVSLAALLTLFVLQRPIFAMPLLVAAAMLLVCLATGRWLKISHHVMFAVLPAGWLWPDRAAVAALALVALAIAWSRLRLQRHTRVEVVAGAMLGAAGAGAVAWLLR